MLETIHEFARESLQESIEAEAIKRAHAGYFLALAEEAELELHGPQQTEWLVRLEVEHDNLRVALSWSLGRGEAEMALRIAGALSWFWKVRGHLSEGLRWLEEALDRGGSAGASSRAEALRGAGLLATDLGEYEKAALHYGDALTLFRQLGESKGLADSLWQAGWTAMLQGDHERASAMLEEGLALARGLGYEWVAGSALNGLAGLAGDRGDLERAQAMWEEALVILRKLGDSQGAAAILMNMGFLGLIRGDFERTKAMSEEALVLAREVEDKVAIPQAHMNMGLAAAHQGDLERARALLAEALVLLRELDAKLWVADNLEGFAVLAGMQGETERGVRLWGAADALRRVLGTPWLPMERAFYEPYLIAARSRLDEAAWEATWEEGQSMTTEEAVAYALENIEDRA
jgi:tetratricopeptide (TPR) repeat protein